MTALAVVALAACQITQVETPDPAAVPTGTLAALGQAAIGPVVEVGSGTTQGIGWRYSVYEAADGWCTQLEMQAVSETGCGDPVPADGGAFGMVGHSGPIVHGIVSADTATVWMVANGTDRVAVAKLMPLEPAGLEDLAFVGFAPEGTDLTHLMAVKLNGEILETYELP